jgi:hypothetical protein
MIAADTNTDAANVAAIVAAFDGDTFARLTAADFRVGKAYAIGRRLSRLHDCTARPSDTSASLDGLRLRVQELRSVLKPHAAKAVIDSVDYWTEWLAHPRSSSGKTITGDTTTHVRESLPRQVHRWRGMLTGEKDPADLLSSDNYLAAGSGIVEGYMHLGREYARRWWPYLLTVTAVIAVIVAAILKWGGGNSGAVAAIITALAGVGITGRSVSTTLSKAASEIAGSLREAELDTAMGAAATILPANCAADPATLVRYRNTPKT